MTRVTGGEKHEGGRAFGQRIAWASAAVLLSFLGGGLRPLLASAWPEVAKLVASEPHPLASLGHGVAIEGERLVLGAPFTNEAYVYELDAEGRWIEVARLTASDGGGDFGTEVGISADTAGVTSPAADGRAGAAYVYEREVGGVWVETAKLKPPDTEGEAWGNSIAIDGDTIAVGAALDDDGLGFNTGAIYIFGRDPNDPDEWRAVAKLLASDGGSEDRLGKSVDLDGDTLVAGSDAANDLGLWTGAAYVFRRDGSGAWVEAAKLTAAEGEEGDGFGESVAVSESTVVVGAPGGAEAAWVFEEDGSGVWLEVAKLTAFDAQLGDEFGNAVDIDNDSAVVGAKSQTDSGFGAAYVYERNRGSLGSWGEVAKLTASDQEEFDNLGFSVGISGRWVVASSPGDDDGAFDAGAGYLYARVDPVLAIAGTCPGIVAVALSGATPSLPVALLGAAGEGSMIVPSGRCAGREIGLAEPKLLAIRRTDRDGELSLVQPIEAGACGRFLQVLDGFTCQVSGVEQLR